jgi:hypothetical protein
VDSFYDSTDSMALVTVIMNRPVTSKTVNLPILRLPASEMGSGAVYVEDSELLYHL